MKIILWGTGSYAARLYEFFDVEIVLVIDNNKEKWRKQWNSFVINSPDVLLKSDVEYDKLIIASMEWRSIRNQIINNYPVPITKIDNIFFIYRKNLLEYCNLEQSNITEELSTILDYVKENPLDVFNADFTYKYFNMNFSIFYDEDINLYYVWYKNKKMYFNRKIDSEQKAIQYYRGLLLEQDEESPHKYQTKAFKVDSGSIILDAGVAEGNFALEVIEEAAKIYLVEADSDWIEALKYTFEPYKNKVVMIEGFLGDGADRESITIDEIIGTQDLDFIKMDIEGAEVSALRGAKNVLKNNSLKLDICAYHNSDDEKNIRNLLEEFGYITDTSNSYMFFLTEKSLHRDMGVPQWVRGLVRAVKK